MRLRGERPVLRFLFRDAREQRLGDFSRSAAESARVVARARARRSRGCADREQTRRLPATLWTSAVRDRVPSRGSPDLEMTLQERAAAFNRRCDRVPYRRAASAIGRSRAPSSSPECRANSRAPSPRSSRGTARPPPAASPPKPRAAGRTRRRANTPRRVRAMRRPAVSAKRGSAAASAGDKAGDGREQRQRA